MHDFGTELRIDPALFPLMGHLAPGVVGYEVEKAAGVGLQFGDLYVPLIAAEREGAGDVGRYLDSLPRDRRVVVPNVLNLRLAGMLARRGFRETTEAAEVGLEFESVPVWERLP